MLGPLQVPLLPEGQAQPVPDARLVLALGGLLRDGQALLQVVDGLVQVPEAVLESSWKEEETWSPLGPN